MNAITQAVRAEAEPTPAIALPSADADLFALIGRAAVTGVVAGNVRDKAIISWSAANRALDQQIIATRARTPHGVSWKAYQLEKLLRDQEHDLGWWCNGMLGSIIEDLVEMSAAEGDDPILRLAEDVTAAEAATNALPAGTPNEVVDQHSERYRAALEMLALAPPSSKAGALAVFDQILRLLGDDLAVECRAQQLADNLRAYLAGQVD